MGVNASLKNIIKKKCFVINYLKEYVIWDWTFKGRNLLIFPLLGGTFWGILQCFCFFFCFIFVLFFWSALRKIRYDVVFSLPWTLLGLFGPFLTSFWSSKPSNIFWMNLCGFTFFNKILSNRSCDNWSWTC